MSRFRFQDVARLPLKGDNCAIATQSLDPKTEIEYGENVFSLDSQVLEGHRFAIRTIARDEALLSWGLPFGRALEQIAPGDYVCNEAILQTLRARNAEWQLPSKPNFRDEIKPFQLDESQFECGEQVSPRASSPTFAGYPRGGDRGVGTRNYIVILGTSSRTSSFARMLAQRLKPAARRFPNIDGVVALSHTEGGSAQAPNNLELLQRTLAGFMVHPNVGAILAVDVGSEYLSNQRLLRFMQENDYPIQDICHQFLSLRGSLHDNLQTGERIVEKWFEPVNAFERTQEPLETLKVALQCGGSDAFSGVSANPLASHVAREIIRHGGSANLAETDELIGAETYVLQNVKDLETARRFLTAIERFKERVSWHGHTAEGNPSGGNKLRGLYNIVLKSIGAAMKRHPEVRLDDVIEYGERMQQPGFYFMDSPGNDLESVAGQVASGANLIFFTTGNGSITNFPFVPTLKIMSTTRRYQLVSQEMDVNAGAYLDGTPMEELALSVFDLALKAASGARTKGERAGHAQVSIWRNWRQTNKESLKRLINVPKPGGEPLAIRALEESATVSHPWHFQLIPGKRGYALDRIGLILPTSLCSGEIARMAAEHLNQKQIGRDSISRFVALPHTEGCGVSGSEEIYARTLLGYLTHPMVKFGLLLEHGCEKTHNAYFRSELLERGLEPQEFGWASVQLDGGIRRVLEKIEDWFATVSSRATPLEYEMRGPESLRVALLSSGDVSEDMARALADFSRIVVGRGGSVIVPEQLSPLVSPVYRQEVLGNRPPERSLAYGQRADKPGFHVMEAPSEHWVETLTGVGATGVTLMLGCIAEHPMQGHPMIPLIQISEESPLVQEYREDFDHVLQGGPAQWPDQIFQLIADLSSQRLTPKHLEMGHTDFQFSRGLLGVSM